MLLVPAALAAFGQVMLPYSIGPLDGGIVLRELLWCKPLAVLQL